jgi:hypothetical protein
MLTVCLVCLLYVNYMFTRFSMFRIFERNDNSETIQFNDLYCVLITFLDTETMFSSRQLTNILSYKFFSLPMFLKIELVGKMKIQYS